MLQIALMGITRGIIGFLINFWYAIEDLVNPFLEAFYSLPLVGSFVELIFDIIW